MLTVKYTIRLSCFWSLQYKSLQLSKLDSVEINLGGVQSVKRTTRHYYRLLFNGVVELIRLGWIRQIVQCHGPFGRCLNTKVLRAVVYWVNGTSDFCSSCDKEEDLETVKYIMSHCPVLQSRSDASNINLL